MRLFRLLGCLLFLLPALGIAQQARYVPDGLSEGELKVLEIQGLNDKAFSEWARLRVYQSAVENLRRAGVLGRCAALHDAKSDDYYFDPAMRAALDGVVDKMLAGKIIPVNLQDFRYVYRGMLWAQRHASAADWQAVLRRLQTPAGQRAVQRMRALSVIGSYEGRAMDVNTGNWLAYPPIALKAYFTQSGQLDAFERALQKVDPKLRADFARVRTAQDHGAADLPWLREVDHALADKEQTVQQAFFDELSEEERKSIDGLNDTAFMRLYADAAEASTFPTTSLFPLPNGSPQINDPKFSGMTIGDRSQPNYLDFVSASLNSEYPQSGEQFQALMRMGPREYIDGAQRAFCPPG